MDPAALRTNLATMKGQLAAVTAMLIGDPANIGALDLQQRISTAIQQTRAVLRTLTGEDDGEDCNVVQTPTSVASSPLLAKSFVKSSSASRSSATPNDSDTSEGEAESPSKADADETDDGGGQDEETDEEGEEEWEEGEEYEEGEEEGEVADDTEGDNDNRKEGHRKDDGDSSSSSSFQIARRKPPVASSSSSTSKQPLVLTIREEAWWHRAGALVIGDATISVKGAKEEELDLPNPGEHDTSRMLEADEFGKWHGSGYAMRLLEQMGYQPGRGLGKNEDGIPFPIRSCVRPVAATNGGLGLEAEEKPRRRKKRKRAKQVAKPGRKRQKLNGPDDGGRVFCLVNKLSLSRQGTAERLHAEKVKAYERQKAQNQLNVLSVAELRSVLGNKMSAKDNINHEIRKLQAKLGGAGTNGHIIAGNIERKRQLLAKLNEEIQSVTSLMRQKEKREKAIKF